MAIEQAKIEKKGVFLVVVDSTEECAKAIDYACYYANAQNGYVALLNVIADQSAVMNWRDIEKRIRKEAREQAEQMIWESAGRVLQNTGKIPIACIEEGSDRSDIIVDMIEQNENIVGLVLASAANSSKPGPLVDYFSGKGMARLPVPLLIVPGHLSEIGE